MEHRRLSFRLGLFVLLLFSAGPRAIAQDADGIEMLYPHLEPPLAERFTLVGDDNRDLRGWSTNVLSVAVNLSDCPRNITMSLIERAMAVWNQVIPERIALRVAGTSQTTPEVVSSGDAPDTPLLLCDRKFGDTTGSDPESVPALTGVAVHRGTDRIVYAYVMLNAEEDAFDNVGKIRDEQLLVILAHEFGHLLGLGHSQERSALMYFDVTGKIRATLTGDDIEGLRYVYLRPEDGDGPLGCSSIARAGRDGPRRGLGAPLAEFALLLGGIGAVVLLMRRWPQGCASPRAP